ncbi:MAG TPA: DUF2183 domain-containing protein [Polyangiaceae bacterium LLY-WYZ-14_1]|jgi:hypothetical protein|nr:DUF2183 domain-containing protein [Polyangiaceae bacterium LLY-WYZ-14_1]
MPERSRGVVYRWDLDKTYLRTEFDTVRELVRTAFETPARKRTVPGASALLREIRATGPRAITILSGSPEQMRRALEAKLRIDGIEWDDFMLKPSLENLLRGRIRFLTDQVGYKLGALLQARRRARPGWDEVLFGDDAEADAFIYSLYADLCAGRVGTRTLRAVLQRARLYPEDLPVLLSEADGVGAGREVVRRIFIHLDRVSVPGAFSEFGDRVCPFHNYFQPAVVLVEDGLLEAPAALRVGSEIAIRHGFSPDTLTASFLDLVRRGFVGRRAGQALRDAIRAGEPQRVVAAKPILAAFADDLDPRVDDLPAAGREAVPVLDYVGLYARDEARAKAAKRRALLRRPK